MKTKKKSPPKAITLLTRVQTLLADVLDGCSVIEKSVEKNVRELLVSAESSISKAKDFITPSASTAPRHTAAKSRPRAKAKRVVRAKKVPAVHAA
ncbi:MAG TPA: hypothetical protein VMD76_07140 [Candidatus Sulfotelmatobacter sp.]|jgi:hypothetical protein|nr:hypothetical protein [Candidatus Sulfotelmatobacter sp.]